jgi:cyanophycinase
MASQTKSKSKAESTESIGPGGMVMAIGGAESKDRGQTIVTRFVEAAGGPRARMVVIPTASEDPIDSGRLYRELFAGIGVASVSVLEIIVGNDANSENHVGDIRGATGVFITGGEQARLIALPGGTLLMDELPEA